MRTAPLAIAAAGALAAVVAGAAVVLTDQAPYPYAQRRVLDLPLRLLTVRRLDVLLQPRPGERVLEITSAGAPASPWPTTRSSPPARPDPELVQAGFAPPGSPGNR